MLEGQRIDALAVQAFAHMHLAHQAHEYGEPADALVALGQAVELGAGIEIGFLDAHGHGQPTREGREERDFARAGQRRVERRCALVDCGAEGRAFGQRFGMAGAARRATT